MCISVDRPLWEGRKPVSIPAGAWTPLRSCPIPKAMPTRNPFPMTDRKSRVLDDGEEGAACAEWGSWDGCPSQGTNPSDEGRKFDEREKNGIRKAPAAIQRRIVSA